MNKSDYRKWCDVFGSDFVDSIIEKGENQTKRLENLGVEYKSTQRGDMSYSAEDVRTILEWISETSQKEGWTEQKTLATIDELARQVAMQSQATDIKSAIKRNLLGGFKQTQPTEPWWKKTDIAQKSRKTVKAVGVPIDVTDLSRLK